MELRQLRYFVEIADRGTYTRASEELAIAQPALSTQMQKLEAEFGTALFVRSKRGITLTEAGRSVLPDARRTLAAADATARTAALAANAARARLVLGYSPFFPFVYTTRVIRTLMREHPGLNLQLREMPSREQVPAVLDGAIDLAFIQETPGLETGDLVRVRTAEAVATAALPSTHRLSRRRAIAFTDLSDEPFVMPTNAFADTVREQILAACRAAGFSPRIVQDVTDIRVLLGLVSAGLGVSIMTSIVKSLRFSGVSYVALKPPLVIRFTMLYRRELTRGPLGPQLARLADEARATARTHRRS